MAKKPKIKRVVIDANGNVSDYKGSNMEQRINTAKERRTTLQRTNNTIDRKPIQRNDFSTNNKTDIRTLKTENVNKNTNDTRTVKTEDIQEQQSKAKAKQEYEKTKKNLNRAEQAFQGSLSAAQHTLGKEYEKRGVDFTNRFDDYSKKKLDFQAKKEGIKPEKSKIDKNAVKEARQAAEKDYQKAAKDYQQWQIANYENNVAKVNNEDSSFLDKTVLTPVRAINDLLSPITDSDSMMVDEKGNKTWLPSYNELKQQKVRQDTKGVGGFLQDIGYNATKILGAGLIDAATAGVGGKALYWTDMATDNFKQAKNEGADNNSAIANTIVSTGTEFLTEKLLGGLSKKLTGGKASQLQNTISNKIYKIVKEPKVANIIGSMGSEGAEEFLQEWIGALNDAATLGKDIDVEETLRNSLYSAAVGAGSGGVVTGTNNAEGIQAQRGIDEANGLIDILNQRKAQTTDKRALNAIDKALGQAQNYVDSPFSRRYENTNQELNNAIGKIDRRLAKVQNLPEVEKAALTEITQKRLNGETLNENDIATINYLNGKEDTVGDIANQQVQEVQRAVENGTMDKTEAAQEIQAINNTLVNQGNPINEQQEIEQSPVEQSATEEKQEESISPKQEEVKEKPKKQENKRIFNGRNYSSDSYSKLSDDDIKSLDAIYTKQKNKEALTESDRKQLDYFKRKSKGLKHPELTTNNTFEETRKDLSKTNLNKYDDSLMKQAKNIVEANKQGRRTKQQWLDTAKYMGMQMQDADSQSIKEYALQTFKSERPNVKDNLNRQGSKFVDFKVNEWVNAFYEGAGVGKQKTNNKVENNNKVEYNKDTNEKESVQDDFRRVQEESRKMSTRDTEMYHSGEKQVDEGIRNRLSTVLGGELRTKSSSGRYGNTSLVNPKTNKTVNYYTNVDADTFHDNMEIVQKYLRNGDAVDVHEASDYKDTKNYLSEDGLSGFAITKDGDLISVFNLGEKGYLDTIAPEVKKNAKTLDCFQSDVQPLSDMYEKKLGFKKASIMDFNYDFLVEEKGKEYADYFVKTYGEAPVVFMVQTDQDVELKHFNKDQYEEAMNYRNSFLNNEGTSDSSFSNEKNTNIPAKKEEDVIKVKTKEQEREHLVKNGVSKEAAKILSEMPKPDDLTMKEKIKQGKASVAEEWQYFKRNLVDKGETIYTIAKKTKNRLLYAKYDKRGTTTGEANYDIGKAQTDLNGKEFKNFKVKDENGKIKNVAMSLNDIWKGMDVELANEYLANWLNVDRYPQMNETGRRLQASLQERIDKGKLTQEEANEIIRKHEGNKYVLSPDITDKDSRKRIKKMEKEHPELKLFGENIWQYGKNQLQIRVESGEISQAQANQFLKETPHYVRLQREVPQKSTNNIEFDKNGNAKINRQLKEFKGSNYNILPFKEVMAQNTLDVRNTVRDNMFAQELAKTLGISADGGKVTDINDIMGIDEELVARRGVEDNGDGTYSLTFYNNGGLVTIPINEGIYEALQPNKTYDIESRFIPRNFRKIDNIRKALLTDKNPLFLATNMMKDFFDAPLNSRYPLLFGKNYLKAIKEIVLQGGKGKNYQQYQALGGLQNTYFENQSFQKQGSMKNPLNWITKANNAIEQLPRLAEFMSTMEKTGNIDEAMYNAAEITTNFKRGGDMAKALNRNGATFLNASIQGFSKQVRNFSDAFSIRDGKISVDARQATQMLAKAVILGIAPAVLNDWAFQDDEDYQDLQEYIKDNYYLLGKTKNGTWVRIPKGRAVSVFQSAARRAKYQLKGDNKAFKGFWRQASNQIAPNNPLENNILSPFLDVAANKSWSGNEIVSKYKENKTHQGEVEQDMKTDKLSKWLGKTFNYSPKKINYIIDQYSGVLGDIVLPLGTDYAESKSDNPLYQAFVNPLISKFTTNSVTSSKSQQEFYDALSKANDDNDKSWSGRTPKHQAIASYLGSESKKISDIRKKITELQESDKSNREKFEGSLEYTKQINEIAKNAVKQSKKVEKSNGSIKIGDAEFTIANGEATKVNQKTVDAAKEFGISAAAYQDISTYKYNARADKDESGKTIRGTAKQKVVDYVYSKEELTEAQKKAIIDKLYSRK